MFDLILMVALSPLAADLQQQQPTFCSETAPAMVAQFRPCVWPNKCKAETQAVAQFRPCVWPNKCKAEQQPVAQFRPCVWPNKCKASEPLQFAQVKPCVFPNRCGRGAVESLI